mmetsp:Transcript_20566/g.52726  ORF Transcript_20566/g.52726 Transcript_20566/m.52726 type:complete len:339 (-) Transcript_20566:36-1052(-)
MSDNPFNDNPFQASTGGGLTTSGIVAAVESDDSPMTDVWSSGAPAPAPTGAPSANPYSEVPAPAANPYSEAPPAAQPSGAYNGAGAGNGPSGAADKSVSERERELMAREATLAAKEAQIARLETEAAQNAALAAADLKNWPRCCPMVRHDIPGEIPPNWQGPVTKAYWSYLGLIACLIMNALAVTVISFGTGEELGSFFLAVIYLVTATPLAMFLWYMRLYNATIRDRAITFGFFFVMYLIHVIFCFWAAIAPPIGSGGSQRSFAGLFLCLNVFSEGLGFGILAVIGTIMWALEAVWSLLVLQQTYSQFRAGGGTARLQQQAGSAAQTMQMMTGANNA